MHLVLKLGVDAWCTGEAARDTTDRTTENNISITTRQLPTTTTAVAIAMTVLTGHRLLQPTETTRIRTR